MPITMPVTVKASQVSFTNGGELLLSILLRTSQSEPLGAYCVPIRGGVAIVVEVAGCGSM